MKSVYSPLELAQNTVTTALSKDGCIDDEASCDKLSHIHEQNDMSTCTRYRGKVDWDNAYRRFGYTNSLNFQKVTELEWQQEGNGGRSFDVFMKEPEDAPDAKAL